MLTPRIALLAAAALFLGACAPVAEKPSQKPVLFKVTRGVDGPSAAAPGQEVIVQGRYLGGPSNSIVVFRANERGEGGTATKTADVVSWGSDEVVVKVPAGVTPGGGFVVVDVAGVKSNVMPFSITETPEARAAANAARASAVPTDGR